VVEVPEITSKQQWYALLNAAKLRNEKLREDGFYWTIVSAIEGRLVQMQSIVESGRTPSLCDRERGMGLAVIALRSIYNEAPDYCSLLLQLASGFDRWSALPDADDGCAADDEGGANVNDRGGPAAPRESPMNVCG
jgi:hypothetical protein